MLYMGGNNWLLYNLIHDTIMYTM